MVVSSITIALILNDIFKAFRVGETYIQQFLLSLNLSESEVFNQVYPWAIYSYAFFLVLVLILSLWVKAYYFLVVEGVADVITYMIICVVRPDNPRPLHIMKIMQVFFGLMMSCSNGFYAYPKYYFKYISINPLTEVELNAKAARWYSYQKNIYFAFRASASAVALLLIHFKRSYAMLMHCTLFSLSLALLCGIYIVIRSLMLSSNAKRQYSLSTKQSPSKVIKSDASNGNYSFPLCLCALIWIYSFVTLWISESYIQGVILEYKSLFSKDFNLDFMFGIVDVLGRTIGFVAAILISKYFIPTDTEIYRNINKNILGDCNSVYRSVLVHRHVFRRGIIMTLLTLLIGCTLYFMSSAYVLSKICVELLVAIWCICIGSVHALFTLSNSLAVLLVKERYSSLFLTLETILAVLLMCSVQYYTSQNVGTSMYRFYLLSMSSMFALFLTTAMIVISHFIK